jgi:hypothetical protein
VLVVADAVERKMIRDQQDTLVSVKTNREKAFYMATIVRDVVTTTSASDVSRIACPLVSLFVDHAYLKGIDGVNVLVVDQKIDDTVSILANIIGMINLNGSIAFAKLAVRLGGAASVTRLSKNVDTDQMEISVVHASTEKTRPLRLWVS